jgi:tetratricopeptide (TPR) repeat protein
MPRKTAQDLLTEGESLFKAGRLDEAAGAFRAALAPLGSGAAANKVRARLAVVLMRLGRFDEASGELEKVVRGDPSPEARFRLAQAHAFGGRGERAGELLDGLLGDLPDDPPTIARTAALLEHLGRGGEALALLDGTLARGLRSHEIAHTMATLAISHGREREAVALLEPFLNDSALPVPLRAELHFSAGRLLDAIGDFDRAWAVYTEGNRLVRRPFDPIRHERMIDSIIRAFTPEAVRSIAQEGSEGRRAILIVGMPRSGTTLVDQILGAHPSVAAGGESRALHAAIESIPGVRAPGSIHPPLDRVKGQALRRARASYLGALDAIAKGADRVTDKMPQNFLHLGLVPALLPGAGVVHCLRDPRDTALSCYFRNFVGGNAFSTDLAWIAAFMRGYRRLMRHWARVLPEGCRPVEVRYEALSEDPGTHAPAMLAALGLPWDEACLGFGKRRAMRPTLEPDQVGRGVYASSVARWTRYEHRLAPFIEAMGGALDGPAPDAPTRT